MAQQQYNPPIGLTRRVPRGRDVYGVQPPPSPIPVPSSAEQQMATKFDYQRMLMELQEKLYQQRIEDEARRKQAEAAYNVRAWGGAQRSLPVIPGRVPNV